MKRVPGYPRFPHLVALRMFNLNAAVELAEYYRALNGYRIGRTRALLVSIASEWNSCMRYCTPDECEKMRGLRYEDWPENNAGWSDYA